MQKQLEKSADQKSKASSSSEEKNDYRNVAPPHKFSDAAYDEQKKQIADDMDEAVQIAAELIKAEKQKKKQSATAVSTRDEAETTPKKRRHSDDDALEDGELTAKKPKKTSGATGAFFVGIDLGDVSSDDDDDDDVVDVKKKKVAKKN